MSRLVLAGAGGFGREVFSWASATSAPDGRWRDVVFIDDRPDVFGSTGFPARCLGTIAGYRPEPDDFVAVTVGQPAAKLRIHDRLAPLAVRFPPIVHPSALVGAMSTLGEGCIVCPGGIVTANTRIGRHVTLNVYATVGHDARIGDYCTLGGHADVTGCTTLGDGVFLGSHAVIAPGVSVGAWAVIGAGTVALRDVDERATLLGVPGKHMGVYRGSAPTGA